MIGRKCGFLGYRTDVGSTDLMLDGTERASGWGHAVVSGAGLSEAGPFPLPAEHVPPIRQVAAVFN